MHRGTKGDPNLLPLVTAVLEGCMPSAAGARPKDELSKRPDGCGDTDVAMALWLSWDPSGRSFSFECARCVS